MLNIATHYADPAVIERVKAGLPYEANKLMERILAEEEKTFNK